MKKYVSLFMILVMCMSMLVGCVTKTDNKSEKTQIEGIQIELSDSNVLVDGVKATHDDTQAVYVAHDIVYYEEGHDFTYGEGEKEDEHSKEEANKHLVVHITKPGNYVLTGKMSAGQVAIDLGKDSKKDPEAVVNLYLNGVEINNTVAPAIIFYNVYEPFNEVDEKTATKDVDTSNAGANVFIVDDTVNNITGSHVARIYKPDSVILSEDGKFVEDAKKLHKYDAAFYSKVTMNVNGGANNTGLLNIKADNEGLDSELHLTINGGIINIESGNDGINTNEDGVSVTTINGGTLNIFVNGSTGEGDGIDSNGWLVINGGTVTAEACGFSMDSGIDSDMGIHINGGTVIATGNMLDRISESNQTYAILNFSKFLGAGTYSLKNSDNVVVLKKEIKNSFTSLIISSTNLIEGDYTLWYNDTQLVGFASDNGGMFGGSMPNFPMGEMPEGMTPPKDFNGQGPTLPEGFDPNKMKPDMEGMTPPDNFNRDKMNFDRSENRGQRPNNIGGNMPNVAIPLSEIFTIKSGENFFSFISIKE